MTTYIGIHDVLKIELSAIHLTNSSSRTLRIVTHDFKGNEQKTEITFYGATKALDALPRAIDFHKFSDEPEVA